MTSLPEQFVVEVHAPAFDNTPSWNRTYTQCASSRTQARTEVRTSSRNSARSSAVTSSNSRSRVIHTHTAGSSVSSAPNSTIHDLTGVGSS